MVISIPQLDLFHHWQVLANQLFSHLLGAHISPKDRSDHIVFPSSNVLSDLFPQGLAQFTLVNHFLLIVSACSFPIYLCFIGYIVCFLFVCVCLVIHSLLFPPSLLKISYFGVALLICSTFIPVQV